MLIAQLIRQNGARQHEYWRLGIQMIPLGYLYKTVEHKPDWINNQSVIDIYSLSGCISKDFTKYIDYWMHNGYWLFNSPNDMFEIANIEKLDLSKCTLFYYEGFEVEYFEERREWLPYLPESSFMTAVELPAQKILHGFDITSFSVGTSPECSPLSCNPLVDKIQVNSHCLFNTFEDAKASLESGEFDNDEPGPYRIIGVYTVC